MLQAVKLLFIVFRGLIFDHKDEYNIRSPEFKPKKMITFILIVMSFVMNIIFIVRLYNMVGECAILRGSQIKPTVQYTKEPPTAPPK